MQLISLQARSQVHQRHTVAPGDNRFAPNTTPLQPGTYLLRSNDGRRVHAQRVSVGQP